LLPSNWVRLEFFQGYDDMSIETDLELEVAVKRLQGVINLVIHWPHIS